MKSRVGSKNCVLHGCEHWRHMANMVEQLCMIAMSGSAIKVVYGQFPNYVGLS